MAVARVEAEIPKEELQGLWLAANGDETPLPIASAGVGESG